MMHGGETERCGGLDEFEIFPAAETEGMSHEALRERPAGSDEASRWFI